MGEFVKSASSTVELSAEMRFRKEYGDRLRAGKVAEDIAPTTSRPGRGGRPSSVMPKVLTRAEREALKPKRVTSWDTEGIDEADRAVWRRAGLGDDDAKLALYLLENGVLPEDLSLPIRGRRASVRLREGLDTRTVVVKEILEARSLAPVQRRELPSTKVVRKDRAGNPAAFVGRSRHSRTNE